MSESDLCSPADKMECLSTEDLKNLIDDDHYKAFKRNIEMKGKGRRPNLPVVTKTTNKLIAQLFVLKEETQSTFAEVKQWLEKLIPNVSAVTESRIQQRAKAVMDTCYSLDIDSAKTFLDESFDFNSLPPALEAIGLTRLHLTDEVPFTAVPIQGLTNEVVVCLEHVRSKLHQPPIFVRKWIQKLTDCGSLTDSQLAKRVSAAMKSYQRCSKRSGSHKEVFLKEMFFASPAEVNVTHECNHCKVLTLKLKEKETEITNSLHKNNLLSDDIELKNEVIHDLQLEKTELLSKFDEVRDRERYLVNEINKLKSLLRKEKEEKENLKEQLDNVKSSSLYKQNYAHKKDILLLKKENAALKCDIEGKDEIHSSLHTKVISLKEKVKSEQTLKSKYKLSLMEQKCQNSELSKMLSSDEQGECKLRENNSSHRFSDSVRKTYYALQDSIPVGQCSKVISTVARNLFDYDICESDLPCQSTALNMSSEAHIIAKEHVLEEMKNSNHFTYACDGTSRVKIHYLEKHVILSNGKTLSLGFSEIASDDSDTLLEQCVSCLKDLCHIYCKDVDVSEDVIFKELIGKMKCILTDRASVCKAFDSKMAEYKNELLRGEDASTHFLFCNAHFLLALSAAAGEALIAIEKQEGISLGRDALPKFAGWESKGESAAGRVIRLAASLVGPRCDEKSGCREEWLAYCSANEFKSTFTSHRSNRFNNLFANATALIRHRESLLTFLKDFASHSNKKFDSVIADLEDEKVIVRVVVLSYLHIYFTDPYWKLMNSHKSYAEFPFYVKKMRDVLDEWMCDDFDPVKATSVFHDFEVDPVDSASFNAYLPFINMSCFCQCLKDVVAMFQSALLRQLNDFLEDGVFGGHLDDNVQQILKTCPLTNLTGERLFGDLDYDINKRRNTSVHLRTTTSMWKRNKTAKWLHKKNNSVANKLVAKAIKYGHVWRQKKRDETKTIKEKIKMKIEANKLQKYEKANKLKERQVNAIDAILGHSGGIAETKKDLDFIYAGPQAVERLKDQIRFRRLVRGENITMKGNKAMLYDRLLAHISKTT